MAAAGLEVVVVVVAGLEVVVVVVAGLEVVAGAGFEVVVVAGPRRGHCSGGQHWPSQAPLDC